MKTLRLIAQIAYYLFGLPAILLLTGIFFFSTVYLFGVYIDAILVIIFFMFIYYVFLIIARKLFNYIGPKTIRKAWTIGVAIFALFFILTFLLPWNQVEYEKIDQEPKYIKTTDENHLATYEFTPQNATLATEHVVYVTEGPGGYVTKEDAQLLQAIANEGYIVHAYDSMGTNNSPTPRSKFDYTVENDAIYLSDVINSVPANDVALIAKGYGNNVSSRFIARNPQKINKYIIIDGNPIYDYTNNAPSQPNLNLSFSLNMPSEGYLKFILSDPISHTKQLVGFTFARLNNNYLFPFGLPTEYYDLYLFLNQNNPEIIKDNVFNIFAGWRISNTISTSQDFTEILATDLEINPDTLVIKTNNKTPNDIIVGYNYYFKNVLVSCGESNKVEETTIKYLKNQNIPNATKPTITMCGN